MSQDVLGETCIVFFLRGVLEIEMSTKKLPTYDRRRVISLRSIAMILCVTSQKKGQKKLESLFGRTLEGLQLILSY